MVVSFYQSISVSSRQSLTFESRPSSGILQKLQQVVSSAPAPIIMVSKGKLKSEPFHSIFLIEMKPERYPTRQPRTDGHTHTEI